MIGERWTDGESPRGERAITVDRSAGSWLRARRVLIVGAGTIGTQVAKGKLDAESRSRAETSSVTARTRGRRS